jgi:hypothetical protein
VSLAQLKDEAAHPRSRLRAMRISNAFWRRKSMMPIARIWGELDELRELYPR